MFSGWRTIRKRRTRADGREYEGQGGSSPGLALAHHRRSCSSGRGFRRRHPEKLRQAFHGSRFMNNRRVFSPPAGPGRRHRRRFFGIDLCPLRPGRRPVPGHCRFPSHHWPRFSCCRWPGSVIAGNCAEFKHGNGDGSLPPEFSWPSISPPGSPPWNILPSPARWRWFPRRRFGSPSSPGSLWREPLTPSLRGRPGAGPVRQPRHQPCRSPYGHFFPALPGQRPGPGRSPGGQRLLADRPPAAPPPFPGPLCDRGIRLGGPGPAGRRTAFRTALTGFKPATYGWFLLLALLPQLLGHSSFNWALGQLPASYVAIATLGEPIGAAILAFFFLGETPSPLKGSAAALILAGIILALRRKPADPRSDQPTGTSALPTSIRPILDFDRRIRYNSLRQGGNMNILVAYYSANRQHPQGRRGDILRHPPYPEDTAAHRPGR